MMPGPSCDRQLSGWGSGHGECLWAAERDSEFREFVAKNLEQVCGEKPVMATLQWSDKSDFPGPFVLYARINRSYGN